MYRSPIQHCRECGASVTYRLPDDGDTKLRAICTVCQTVHYENPLNVVGTVPHWGEQVLLCKRNIEPRKGKWTLPAGFMELGETTTQGAARETEEEAGARFEMEPLFSVISLPHGWGHDQAGARLSVAALRPGVNLNHLLDDRLRDPLSGNAVLSGVPVELAALTAT